MSFVVIQYLQIQNHHVQAVSVTYGQMLISSLG